MTTDLRIPSKDTSAIWSARLLGWLIETGRSSITSGEAFRLTDEHRIPDVAEHLIDLEGRGLLRRTESNLGGPAIYHVPHQFHRGAGTKVKAELWLSAMLELLHRPSEEPEMTGEALLDPA